MYYTVQCFTLALKIDIFFEVLLLAFYSVCTMINPALWVTFMMLAIINFITLFLGRKAASGHVAKRQGECNMFNDIECLYRSRMNFTGSCHLFPYFKLLLYSLTLLS